MRWIALGICLATLAGCDGYRYLTSGEVSWKLKKELRDNGAKEVDLASLTSFEWDELFMFGPYTPEQEICARLAMELASCKSKVESPMNKSQILLVFRKAGEIVHVENHYRIHGDFTPLNDHGQVVTPKTAKFSAYSAGEATTGEPWLKLRQRP